MNTRQAGVYSGNVAHNFYTVHIRHDEITEERSIGGSARFILASASCPLEAKAILSMPANSKCGQPSRAQIFIIDDQRAEAYSNFIIHGDLRRSYLKVSASPHVLMSRQSMRQCDAAIGRKKRMKARCKFEKAAPLESTSENSFQKPGIHSRSLTS